MPTKALSVKFMGEVFTMPNDHLGQLASDYAAAHERLTSLVATHGTEHRNWVRYASAETRASEAYLDALAHPSTPEDHPAWAIAEHEFPA